MSLAVIIPTYNRAELVSRAIASVQRQVCAVPFEIIVVDDGSTDDTQRVLAQLSCRDARVKLIKQSNRGVSAARNAGIAALSATVEYVTFLDSDDVMAEGRLAGHLSHFHTYADIEYTMGRLCLTDNIDVERLEPEANARVEVGTTWAVFNSIFRRRVFEQYGGFDTEMRAAEDLDFFLRLAENAVAFHQDDLVCVYYVRHADNMTNDKPAVMKAFAKSIAKSAVRRKSSACKLMLPIFDVMQLIAAEQSIALDRERNKQ